jgi:tight adherence protein B
VQVFGGLYYMADKINYNTYTMSVKEKIFNILKIMPFIYILIYLFSKNHTFSLFLSFSALFYPRIRVKQIIRDRKEELNIQFKDMLYSLQSSLWAGKPIERAFFEVIKDLKILYPDPKSHIILECQIIVGKINMNETVESAISDFARRSDIDDIQDFAEVFKICKRTGGDLIEIVKRTASIINDRIEMKLEINTILAKRNLERRILNILPVVILLLLSLTSQDYINPLYSTTTGRLAMALAASLFIIAYFISKKIMEIKI